MRLTFQVVNVLKYCRAVRAQVDVPPHPNSVIALRGLKDRTEDVTPAGLVWK